jgi:hypothetical protein
MYNNKMGNDETGIKIPNEQGYVLCEAHHWVTLVPCAQIQIVAREHQTLFPDHNEIGCSGDTNNLHEFARNFKPVDITVFNPRSTPSSTG